MDIRWPLGIFVSFFIPRLLFAGCETQGFDSLKSISRKLDIINSVSQVQSFNFEDDNFSIGRCGQQEVTCPLMVGKDLVRFKVLYSARCDQNTASFLKILRKNEVKNLDEYSACSDELDIALIVPEKNIRELEKTRCLSFERTDLDLKTSDTVAVAGFIGKSEVQYSEGTIGAEPGCIKSWYDFENEFRASYSGGPEEYRQLIPSIR